MTKEQVSVGVDPGKTGALSAIGDSCQRANIMPVIKGKAGGSKTELCIDGVNAWFDTLLEDAVIKAVYIERQQAFPKQGGVSNFSTGDTYGMLKGIIRTRNFPMVIVGPRIWKAAILGGTKKDKVAAIQFCKNRYPLIDLDVGIRKVIYHDGMADAACIATWGRMQA